MNQGGFSQKAKTTETVSYCPHWITDMFPETATESPPFEGPYHWSAERVALSTVIGKGVTCRRLPSEESAYPFKFQSNVILGSSEDNLLYQSFKNSFKLLILHKGKVISQGAYIWQDFYIEGPPDNAWTVSDWVFDIPKECTLTENENISNIKTELNGLLNNFKKGLPIDRPSYLLSIANQVANQYNSRKDEDIEAWADKLSKNLSNLSD